jgi:succinylarginine dihydrolase
MDTGTHMKTTIDIADPLLDQARALAAREGVTLKALVELGLRQVIAEKKKRSSSFKLRRVTFKGDGLQPELEGASWERMREMIYGDRA